MATKGITVYLVRHGQTWFNHFNKMQGWSDSPLTENGIKDGTNTGVILRNVAFTHAYCSDTTRATRTADLILSKNVTGKIPLTVTPFFREQFYGYFEGEDSGQTWYMVGFPTVPVLIRRFSKNTVSMRLKTSCMTLIRFMKQKTLELTGRG